MKQNALGLASICILATGVLVMISATVSLYGGMQETLDSNYPQGLYLSCHIYENDNLVETKGYADKDAFHLAENFIGMKGSCNEVAQAFINSYFGEEYNNLTKELRESIVIYLFGTGKIDRDALGKRIKEAFARVLEIRLENGAEPIEPLNIDGINIGLNAFVTDFLKNTILGSLKSLSTEEYGVKDFDKIEIIINNKDN